MLPTLLIEYGLNCYVVNGEYPERVLSIMADEMKNEGCSFEYTFIHNE
jgi:pentatricopeptide repeat protein